MATQAVRNYGMFGDDIGFSTVNNENASEEYNAACDRVVKKILDVSILFLMLMKDSFDRVWALINRKDTELRRLARYLYE